MTVLLPSTAETDLAKFALSLQQLAAGRSNATGTVTLAVSASSTVVSAVNCAPTSAVFLFPKTADAALTVKIQKFTASGTYTPSPGMAYCVIECLGGGGGGGGAPAAATATTVAGGGGSGGYSRLVASAATIGVSQTVTIGAAGAAGAANGAGGSGGDTSVGSLCIGKGGSGSAAAAASGIPGAGGVAGTGDVTGTGARGQATAGAPSSVAIVGAGGVGGSSRFGGGGVGGFSFGSAANGGAATGFGGGGGGASTQGTASTATGGAATAGILIITEYCAAAFVSSVGKQTFTISHDNNAIADRTYFYVCLG